MKTSTRPPRARRPWRRAQALFCPVTASAWTSWAGGFGNSGCRRTQFMTSCLAVPHQFSQQPPQVGEADRLHQVPVATGLLRARPVALLTPTGQGDDDDVPPPRLPADAAGGV